MPILGALGCAPAFADAPRATPGGPPGLPFTHVAIGDPISKLEPHFHGLETGEPTCHRDTGIAGSLTCRYEGAHGGAGIGWFADVPYKLLAFDYLNGRLIGFHLWADVAVYRPLHAHLVRLYGAPRSEDSSIVYDRRGRPLDQIVSMWRTPSGVLELDKRSWSIVQSRLSLTAVSDQTEIITNGGTSDSFGAAPGAGGAAQGGGGAGAAQGGAGGGGLTRGQGGLLPLPVPDSFH